MTSLHGEFEQDPFRNVAIPLTIQYVPKKGNPEKVYFVTKFSLSSFFGTSYKMHWPCMTKHETISNGDVKIDLRRMGI